MKCVTLLVMEKAGLVNITPNARRRRAGLIFLGLAVVMLALGCTLLSQRLKGLGFVVYWLACFGFVLAAGVIAIWDMRDIRRQVREEQAGLMEEAFDSVAAEVKEARDKQRAKRPN